MKKFVFIIGFIFLFSCQDYFSKKEVESFFNGKTDSITSHSPRPGEIENSIWEAARNFYNLNIDRINQVHVYKDLLEQDEINLSIKRYRHLMSQNLISLSKEEKDELYTLMDFFKRVKKNAVRINDKKLRIAFGLAYGLSTRYEELDDLTQVLESIVDSKDPFYSYNNIWSSYTKQKNSSRPLINIKDEKLRDIISRILLFFNHLFSMGSPNEIPEKRALSKNPKTIDQIKTPLLDTIRSTETLIYSLDINEFNSIWGVLLKILLEENTSYPFKSPILGISRKILSTFYVVKSASLIGDVINIDDYLVSQTAAFNSQYQDPEKNFNALLKSTDLLYNLMGCLKPSSPDSTQREAYIKVILKHRQLNSDLRNSQPPKIGTVLIRDHIRPLIESLKSMIKAKDTESFNQTKGSLGTILDTFETLKKILE